MRIGIDLDDVLGECRFIEYYNKTFSTDFDPRTLTMYSYFRGESKEEWKKIVDGFYQSTLHHAMKPVTGSEKGVRELKKSGHNLMVITSRNPSIEDMTCRWLDNYFAEMFDEIAFAGQYLGVDPVTKEDICKERSIDVIIDDAPRHAEGCAAIGIDVLLFDRPWNREVQTSDKIKRVHSWTEIVEAINGR